MHIASGSFVGPYRVLSALGAGGMGEVYRARDEKLNRDVALKILSADMASSSEHLRRFEQEARAASALNHPNIIAIYDIGRADDGIAYIAMELVDGEDVRNLAAGTPLPLKQLLRVAVKVADGLAAAHERGIVHRDLKPENVMVSRDGFVKILDFGLAKLGIPVTDNEATVPHTTPGAVFGTVGYMSPEQASGRAADFRADQFALGVMLYEMLTGRLPFSEPTAAETLAAIIRKEPAPIQNPAIPPDLLRIVARCLEKEPAGRYASTRDLARDLREVRDKVSHPSEERFRSGNVGRPIPRARLWVAAVAAAVLLIAGGAAWYRYRGTVPRPGSTTIAVLPFTERSGAPDGQVFADGLLHMIIGRVAEARTVRVIDPSDRRIPAGISARDFGRQTGATYVLTGDVDRQKDRVVLRYSMVDVDSGRPLTGDTVSVASTDLLSLQEQLVNRILGAVDAPRVSVPVRASEDGLTSATDQRNLVEAVGLLERSKDEKSLDRAIDILQQILINARDSATVNALLGQAIYNKSQLSRRPALVEQARIFAERAAELDPNLPEVHLTLGHIRSAAGKHAEAAQEYERALALRPDMGGAILGLADANAAMGRAADAERFYRRAIQLRPESASVYMKFGLFCLANGRFQEAVDNLRRSTELMPDSPRVFSNLGAAYQALGRYDDALAAYQKSIAVSPTAGAYSNVGTITFVMGRYAESCAAFEKATELAPADYLMWANLGDAYRWAPGRRADSLAAYKKAMAAAREAHAVNAADPFLHAILALCLAKSDRLDDANDEIGIALKLDPTNATVLYAAGVVAVIRGNNDLAVTWLQQAVSHGYSASDLATDPEFGSLRNDASFRAIVSKPSKTS